MANDYHDAEGKFCSRETMTNDVTRLMGEGRTDDALKLLTDLRDIEQKQKRAAGREEFTASMLKEDELQRAKFLNVQEALRSPGATRSAVKFVLEKNQSLTTTQRQDIAAEFGTPQDIAAYSFMDARHMWEKHKEKMLQAAAALERTHRDHEALDNLTSSIASAARSDVELSYALYYAPHEYSGSLAARRIALSPELSDAQAVSLLRDTLKRSPDPERIRLIAGLVNTNISRQHDRDFAGLWKRDVDPDLEYRPVGDFPTDEDTTILYDEDPSTAKYKAAQVRADATAQMQQLLLEDKALLERNHGSAMQTSAKELEARLAASREYMHNHHQIDRVAAVLRVPKGL